MIASKTWSVRPAVDQIEKLWLGEQVNFVENQNHGQGFFFKALQQYLLCVGVR